MALIDYMFVFVGAVFVAPRSEELGIAKFVTVIILNLFKKENDVILKARALPFHVVCGNTDRYITKIK